MARIKDGHLIGKVGNMVGARWKDKYYLKKAPKRTAPPTEKELEQQFIFKKVIKWLKPLAQVLRIGFRGYHPSTPAWSSAISVLHKEALHKDGYDSFVDPSLARISFGSLELPENIQVNLEEEDQLVFSWDPLTGGANPRDRSLLLAYNTEKEIALYELGGPKRSSGSATLSLSTGIPGIYHVYLAFIEANGTRQSHSRYLGTIELG